MPPLPGQDRERLAVFSTECAVSGATALEINYSAGMLTILDVALRSRRGMIA